MVRNNIFTITQRRAEPWSVAVAVANIVARVNHDLHKPALLPTQNVLTLSARYYSSVMLNYPRPPLSLWRQPAANQAGVVWYERTDVRQPPQGAPWWPRAVPGDARAEGVQTAASFREPFSKGRRCIVPASGYFEWTGPKNDRQPHYFTRADGQPIALAGLWDRWKSNDKSETKETFTIVTTEPSKFAAQFHNRMPVVLEPDS